MNSVNYMTLYNSTCLPSRLWSTSHLGHLLLQLKLDAGTMFEWQKHTQDSTTVPPLQ